MDTVTRSVVKVNPAKEQDPTIYSSHEIRIEMPNDKCENVVITSPKFKAYTNFYILVTLTDDGAGVVEVKHDGRLINYCEAGVQINGVDIEDATKDSLNAKNVAGYGVLFYAPIDDVKQWIEAGSSCMVIRADVVERPIPAKNVPRCVTAVAEPAPKKVKTEK